MFIRREVSSAADSVLVDRCLPRRDGRDGFDFLDFSDVFDLCNLLDFDLLDLVDFDFLDLVRRELVDSEGSVSMVVVPEVPTSKELDLKVEDSLLRRPLST